MSNFDKYGFWITLIIGPAGLYFLESGSYGNEQFRDYTTVVILVALSGLIFTRITRLIREIISQQNSMKIAGDLVLQIILFAILAVFSHSLVGNRGVFMVLIFPVAFLISALVDYLLKKLRRSLERSSKKEQDKSETDNA